ncbi:hypothetical protein WME94_02230 [Sorangium sp. So ce429]
MATSTVEAPGTTKRSRSPFRKTTPASVRSTRRGLPWKDLAELQRRRYRFWFGP